MQVTHKPTRSERPASAAQVKHKRMKDYSFRISKFQRDPIEIKRPAIEKDHFDLKDFKVPRSQYCEQIARLQNNLMG